MATFEPTIGNPDHAKYWTAFLEPVWISNGSTRLDHFIIKCVFNDLCIKWSSLLGFLSRRSFKNRKKLPVFGIDKIFPQS
jgi:hypothetical protein